MPPVKKPFRIRRSTFIKAWREHRGLTQDQAAERIGISRGNYGRIEVGKVPYNQDFLENCAVAFGCGLSDLLERAPSGDSQSETLVDLLRDASPAQREQITRVVKTLLEIKP